MIVYIFLVLGINIAYLLTNKVVLIMQPPLQNFLDKAFRLLQQASLTDLLAFCTFFNFKSRYRDSLFSFSVPCRNERFRTRYY